MAKAPVLTPRIAVANGWQVTARCAYCPPPRLIPVANFKGQAADRDLVRSLARKRILCQKCHRPSEALFVDRPGGARRDRVMTIWPSGEVWRHDDR